MQHRVTGTSERSCCAYEWKGDVVYDDEGVYGDAVNLAARVQALGIPGSVMISGKVFEEIKIIHLKPLVNMN